MKTRIIKCSIPVMLIAGTLEAALVTVLDEKSSGNQGVYASQVSAVDLINNGQATLAGVTVSGYTPFTNTVSDVAALPGAPDYILNNGAHGSSTPNFQGQCAFDPDGVFTVSYYLDTTEHKWGYNLTSIDTFTAHVDNRAAQNYEVFVDYVGGGTNWVSLGTVSSATPGGTGQAHHIQLASAAGANPMPFATGVAAIRFDISVMSGQNPDVWREIDVKGTPIMNLVPSTPVITSITQVVITNIPYSDGNWQVAFTSVGNGSPGVTNYMVSTDNGVTFTALSPAQTVSPIYIRAPAPDATCQVKIKAVNEVGQSDPSSSFGFTFSPFIFISMDEKSSGNQEVYAGQVSAADLINNGQATLAGVTVSGYTPFTNTVSDVAALPGAPDYILNNGAHGSSTPNFQGQCAFDSDGVFTVSYYLDTAEHKRGYNLTSIDTFTAHYDNRASQKYEVFVDYVGGGTNWVSLGTVSSDRPGGYDQAHHIQLARAAGANPPPFATGVTAIRFTIGIKRNADVWREIDIKGVPTPPPGTRISFF